MRIQKILLPVSTEDCNVHRKQGAEVESEGSSISHWAIMQDSARVSCIVIHSYVAFLHRLYGSYKVSPASKPMYEQSTTRTTDKRLKRSELG